MTIHKTNIKTNLPHYDFSKAPTVQIVENDGVFSWRIFEVEQYEGPCDVNPFTGEVSYKPAHFATTTWATIDEAKEAAIETLKRWKWRR
jgi:hypothetical protein